MSGARDTTMEEMKFPLSWVLILMEGGHTESKQAVKKVIPDKGAAVRTGEQGWAPASLSLHFSDSQTYSCGQGQAMLTTGTHAVEHRPSRDPT